MIKIIDNKKIDLTQEEFEYYQSICKSYDTQTRKGSDLFKDLFETDENGIIQFLKSPSSRETSLEVVLFLVNITVHQHIRQMHLEVEAACNEVRKTLQELKKATGNNV
jgi:hypothetical protein